MNYYINTTTNVKYSESEIKTLFPDTSFPIPFVPPIEFELVFPSPVPDYNPVINSVREIEPELTNIGHYEQRWEVVELFSTQEEKDAAIAADIELKRIASIPKFVSIRQAEKALLNAGILDDIEALVNTLPREYQVDWKRATEVWRDNPLVEIVRQSKDMTVQQIDDLFIAASQL